VKDRSTIRLAVFFVLAGFVGACGEREAKDTGSSPASPAQPAIATSHTLYVKAAGMVKKLGIT
jgi:hypothetical protein